MRKARVDIITHVLKALAFGCMAQALALRLNFIGLGLRNLFVLTVVQSHLLGGKENENNNVVE